MRRSKERAVEDARIEALKRAFSPAWSAAAERLIRKGLRGLARNRHEWDEPENYFENENCEINFATRVAAKELAGFGMPVGTPMSKPWAVLCCGCNRVMDPAGKAIGTPHPGALNIGALLEISGQAACFATKPEADDAARAAGWSAVDGNHRCPECAALAERTPYAGIVQRNGAYIHLPSLKNAKLISNFVLQ